MRLDYSDINIGFCSHTGWTDKHGDYIQMVFTSSTSHSLRHFPVAQRWYTDTAWHVLNTGELPYRVICLLLPVDSMQTGKPDCREGHL